MSSKTTQKNCDCWESRQNALETEHGLTISKHCTIFHIIKGELKKVRCLPLERVDGKKLTKKDPASVQISHCPWCGTKYKTL